MHAQGDEKNSMSDSTHQSTPHHANPPARGGPARQAAKVASHARIGFTLRQRSPTRRASSAVGLCGGPPSLLQRLGLTFGTAVGLLLGGLAGSGTGRLVGTEAAVTSGYALGAVVGGVIGSLLASKYFNNTAK